jgi:hypothetical protein
VGGETALGDVGECDNDSAEDPDPEDEGEGAAGGFGGKKGGFGTVGVSSSSSEDGGRIGSCTGARSKDFGGGGAMGEGLFGNEDSSKVMSVDTLMVRVFLSQSL